MWIRDHEPEVYKSTYKSLNSRDYIVLKLTGVFATDYSDASGTLAYNIRKRVLGRRRDPNRAGLDINKFPEIPNGLEVIGYVTEKGSGGMRTEGGYARGSGRRRRLHGQDRIGMRAAGKI